jgi:hypothetical protein
MTNTEGIVIDRAAAVRIATTLGWMPPEELEQLKNENEYLRSVSQTLLWDFKTIERAFNEITGATWNRKADHPKLKWVGLTDAELFEFSNAKLGAYDLCLEVEAKLKEKNT